MLDAGFDAPVSGGFTTRDGGVSVPPYGSLDLGTHVGDDPSAVAVNRARVRAALGGADLAFAQQVHGREVAVVDGPQAGLPPAADALVTVTPGAALVVLAADCLPVLLADVGAGVVAAAHAGRPGLAAGVLEATLAAMAELGATPGSTRAVLGPAVCGSCYELPEPLADEVGERVPGSRSTTRWGTPAVDLAAGAQTLLLRLGVAEVARVGGCTLEQPERFYSYRRDGVTGRHAGFVRIAA